MRGPILALVAFTLATTAIADEPPPVPEGGLTHYKREVCTDPVFGLTGECFYSHDVFNNRYKAFYVGDLGMVIFELQDGEYVEIWRRAADA